MGLKQTKIKFQPRIKLNHNIDDQLFRVEKVLARKGNQLKVRWKGFSRDDDSLIQNQILYK